MFLPSTAPRITLRSSLSNGSAKPTWPTTPFSKYVHGRTCACLSESVTIIVPHLREMQDKSYQGKLDSSYCHNLSEIGWPQGRHSNNKLSTKCLPQFKPGCLYNFDTTKETHTLPQQYMKVFHTSLSASHPTMAIRLSYWTTMIPPASGFQ
jgi:hypothetical protein